MQVSGSAGAGMAKDGSPERVGERAMFSRDAQPFTLASTLRQPVSPPVEKPSVLLPESVEDAPAATGSLRPSFTSQQKVVSDPVCGGASAIVPQKA